MSRRTRGNLIALVAAVGIVVAPVDVAAQEARSNDAPVTVDGPATDATYTIDHSCLTDQVTVVMRTGSSRRIQTELAMFSPDGRRGSASSKTYASSDADEPLFSSVSASRAGSWTFSERYENDGEFVVVAQGTIDCPDYTTLDSSVFIPISPTRVLDTRPIAPINHSGPEPGPGTRLEITPAMMPNLPTGVVAVSANVGIVRSAGRGFAQFLPSGQPAGTSSSVNTSGAGENVLNLAVSPVGADGGVSVFTAERAHLTVDINGYFVASDGAERAGRAVTVPAVRVLDTRSGAEPGLDADTTITIDLAADSALPRDEAAAAIVNITAVRTAGGRGFVQSAASGRLEPGAAAILNTSKVDDSVGALAIVPVTNGAIDVYTSVGTDLIVDVIGWFTNDQATASTSGRFTPLPPERVFDSRYSSPVNYSLAVTSDWVPGQPADGVVFGSGARRADSVTDISMGGIEGEEFLGQRPAASSVFTNIVLAQAAERGYLQAGALDGLVPGAASNVNATTSGQNVGNAAIVPFSETRFRDVFRNDGISVYSSNGGQIVVDVVGFFTR